MDYHVKTEEFRDRYAGLSRKRFLSQFPSPFFLVELRGRKKSDGLGAYARTSTSKLPTLPAVRLSSTVVDSLVVPLEKSNRNDFASVVSIGRDAANDVVLAHPSISKFHAVIRKDVESGGYTISDVGSLNGTTVNGIPVAEGEPEPLASGQQIVFGRSVMATYFVPGEFHDYLRLLQKLKEGREAC